MPKKKSSKKVAKKEVIEALRTDDYAYGQKLGAGAMVHLQRLAHDDDDYTAARAVHLAVLIDPDRAVKIVEDASKSRRRVIRTAAAGAAPYLNQADGQRILSKLIKSKVPGVRKVASRSLAKIKADEQSPGTINSLP